MFGWEVSKQNLQYAYKHIFYFHNLQKGIMIKTKIKKAIALASVVALMTTSFGNSFAALDIGTWSVIGNPSLNQAISWDETYSTGSAVGSVSGIIVTAEVLPTINMVISTDTIDLGVLTAWVEATGSLDIEVGTNAANGVKITARSWSGWLTNISDNSIQINSLWVDGVVEAYNFSSSSNPIDSTASFFATTGDLGVTPVINNTAEHQIYKTNKPEPDDLTDQDVTFTVAATSNAQTAAGNYQDTITFTVTGNF